MASNVPAASAALRMIRYLAAVAAPARAAVIARDLELPRSSVYHLLRVLMDEGFVVHFPEDRVYALSPLLGDLGLATQRTDQLARLGRPILERLVQRSAVPVVAHLAVRSDTEVMYLAREQGIRAPTTVTSIGVRLPAHLTATGRALLSLLAPAQVRALYPHAAGFSMRDTTGAEALKELATVIAQARTRGWATEDGEIVRDYGSTASAAVDRNGMPVAAIGLTFNRERAAEDTWATLGAAVAGAAHELSARVAGRY
ncbi:MAG: helix-turn-helix domain-containing protein [Demequina sp.]|jgi:DNA-binding IclR family transcriptional regulator|nr:helix-turn-helix domain-containing protein [Demequina sp.]